MGHEEIVHHLNSTNNRQQWLFPYTGMYLRQGKEDDCPRPQKISIKFGPKKIKGSLSQTNT